MAALITTNGPNAGQRFPLDGAGTLIGRQPDVAVYLDSLSVSRHHARVSSQDGVYTVEDLGSSNGTYVNGARITGRSPLTEQDELRIGPYTFQLLGDRPPSSTLRSHHPRQHRRHRRQRHPPVAKRRLQAASGAGHRPRPRPGAGAGSSPRPAARPSAAPVPAGRPRHGPAVRGRPPRRPRPAHPARRPSRSISPTAEPSCAGRWTTASAC